jgi:serine protease Do
MKILRTVSMLFLAMAMALARPALAVDSSINLRRTNTVDVVEKTKNAVVYISSTKMVAQRFSPFGNDPFFQDYGETRIVPVGSLGSGFIIHPDGYIVTNNHVIDRARQISVELSDGRKFDAELISADSEADLAILKIRADKPLQTLQLGDSSDLMIGEPVIAVGNPLGYSHSVSTGIVSAIHRDLKTSDGKNMLGDLIQTDAAINPGNSGGPLLNAYGQVIGINTAIRGDAQNIGFAIGINRMRDLIPELMNPSQVTKVDIPMKFRERRVLTPPATIESYVESADGQSVLTIAGHHPSDIVDAYAILLKQKAKDAFTVVLDGQPPMKIDPKSVPPVDVSVPADTLAKAKSKLGVTVEQITPALAGKYGLAIERGMFVSEVTNDSVAAHAGVKAGDVIFQLGPYRIGNLSDFSLLLQHLPATGRVRIGVVRGQAAGFGILDFGAG